MLMKEWFEGRGLKILNYQTATINGITESLNDNEVTILAAYYHGWLDEICSNMKRIVYVRTKDECMQEALKYNTRNELAKKSSAIYTVATRNGWLDEICQHMPIRSKRRKKLIS